MSRLIWIYTVCKSNYSTIFIFGALRVNVKKMVAVFIFGNTLTMHGRDG